MRPPLVHSPSDRCSLKNSALRHLAPIRRASAPDHAGVSIAPKLRFTTHAASPNRPLPNSITASEGLAKQRKRIYSCQSNICAYHPEDASQDNNGIIEEGEHFRYATLRLLAGLPNLSPAPMPTGKLIFCAPPLGGGNPPAKLAQSRRGEKQMVCPEATPRGALMT